MDRIGQQNPGTIIVALFVLAIIVIVPLVIFAGSWSKTPVRIPTYSTDNCAAELSTFYLEYGFVEKDGPIFIGQDGFYIVTFNDSWATPLSGSTCKIIESPNEAQTVFKTIAFRELMKDINSSFFEETRDCINITGAKGSANICAITKPVVNGLNSPAATVVAVMPTEASDAFANSLLSSAWTKRAVTKGTSVIKNIKGSNVLVALEFVEETTCKMQNSPKIAIFELADNGNQIFGKAKKDYFELDTPEKLLATSEYISTLSMMNVEKPLPQYETSDNPVGTVINVGAFILDTATYAAATVSEETIEIISVLKDPGCESNKQSEKFLNFQQKIVNYQSLGNEKYTSFNNILQDYKSQATNAIELEKQAKSRNAPQWLQWAILPKSIFYLSDFSQAPNHFENQLYLSAKTASEERLDYYNGYWDNIALGDIWITAIISILLVAGIVYWKFYHSSIR